MFPGRGIRKRTVGDDEAVAIGAKHGIGRGGHDQPEGVRRHLQPVEAGGGRIVETDRPSPDREGTSAEGPPSRPERGHHLANRSAASPQGTFFRSSIARRSSLTSAARMPRSCVRLLFCSRRFEITVEKWNWSTNTSRIATRKRNAGG